MMIVINFDVIATRVKNILRIHPELVIKEGNKFKKDDSFLFVKQVSSYEPNNYNDLKNMDESFTTIVNKISVEMIGKNEESIILIEKML